MTRPEPQAADPLPAPERAPPSPLRRLAWVGAATALAALGLLAPLDPAARVVLAVTVFAMVMWVSEVVPLAITALASSFLLVTVAGRDATPVFAAYFDPIIVLLLGGFFLGAALTRHGLDVAIAKLVLQRAGTSPRRVLLALMATTAVFSMWISNTAATAIMIPIALGVLAVSGPSKATPLSRSFVLGIAFAANVGGIATPIGTTANPIAIRFLGEAGHTVTFLDWMVRATPIMAAMVVTAWAVLVLIYRPDEALARPSAPAPLTQRQWGVMGIFAATVLLWLTGQWHGLSASMVAIIPVLALFGSGLLREADIAKGGWPTLLLIGGGLALGDAIVDVGLHTLFAQGVQGIVGDGGRATAFAVIAAASILVTVFASNTAAAVIMIPMAIQLADAWQMPAVPLAMLTAVMLSMDFLVPVGTPPNAIAYGTGHIRVTDMLRAGSITSLLSVAIVGGAAWAFW